MDPPKVKSRAFQNSERVTNNWRETTGGLQIFLRDCTKKSNLAFELYLFFENVVIPPDSFHTPLPPSDSLHMYEEKPN